MKNYFVFAAAFVCGFFVCGLLCVDPRVTRRGEVTPGVEADLVRHVYLQTPGEVPKPEFMLRVVHSCRSKDDEARFREREELWRIFLAEADTVFYLEVRRAD